jgi:hypothetical protein
MFRLDDDFLRDLGLGDLEPSAKKDLLKVLYEELELRVGERLCYGLTDQQLEEFEAVIDREPETLGSWLQNHDPNFSESEDFKRLEDALPSNVKPLDLIAEYAAIKWLEVNRPDYKAVVQEVLDELKDELSAKADEILQGTGKTQVPQQS